MKHRVRNIVLLVGILALAPIWYVGSGAASSNSTPVLTEKAEEVGAIEEAASVVPAENPGECPEYAESLEEGYEGED